MTSRHQAVHDLLTRSTVQMRDLTKAQPYHFRGRRDPLTPQGMPSPIRRVAVIAVYLVAYDVLDRSCDARPCRRPLQALH
jgi:hypothetical protein